MIASPQSALVTSGRILKMNLVANQANDDVPILDGGAGQGVCGVQVGV